ncbi:MAG: CPBP family glutamic-type intramembrane protease [Acidobacteriaceae bacterium]
MADVLPPRSAPTSPGDRASSTTTSSLFWRPLSRRRAGLELGIGYGLILIVLWTPPPWQRPLYLLTAIVIAIIFWRSFDSAPSMGLRTGNLLRSLWIVAVALALSSISIGLAIFFHTLHCPHRPIPFFKRYAGYAIWSFVQQLLLQDFFLRRLLRLLPSTGLAALATATIFCIAHLPSPILSVVTFTLGLASCLLFLNYRNLYPLAVAHAILGITLAITIPNAVIHNMRVGHGYLTYRPPHRPAQRSHSDQVLSTSACVNAEAPTLRSRLHARP